MSDSAADSSEAPTLVPGGADAATIVPRPGGADAATPAEGSAEAPTLTPGTSIDRFVVLEEMGRGAMGVVVAAVDPKLERKVAIKLLSRELSGGASALERERFLQEAKAMAQLSHPNVVTVHHVGTWNDRVFVVMEFVRGCTLRDWVAQGHSVGETIRVFAGAGKGLAAAHRAGIVHRDFKPENVLVADDGSVRVTDFGLAGSSSDPVEEELVATDPGSMPFSAVAMTLTRSGTLMGTPAYMSPEQYLQAPLDGRSDQFGFCIALHEAVYGQRPFAANSLTELATAVAAGRRAPPPDGVRVPGNLRRAIERGLQRQRDDRYPDMEALVAELLRPPWWKRTAVMAGVGGVAVAVGGISVPLLQRDEPCDGDEADAAMVAAWSRARADDVRVQFEASGRGHAAATYARVDSALAAYVGGWTAMRREACEAALVEQRQSPMLYDRRMLCLERRRGAAEALIDRLTAADGPVVDRSLRAAQSLPPLAACADVDALLAASPPPQDDTTRERAQALQGEVDAARAHERLGQYAQGWARIEPALAATTELGYARLKADAHQAGGRLAYRVADNDRAEALVRIAAQEAARARDAALEVKAWSTLLYVVGYRQGRHDEAAGLLAGATGALARAGDPQAEHGHIDTNYALVLWDAGRLDEARKHGEAAVQALTDAFGEDHLDVATALHNLGNVLRDAGKWAEALRVLRRALEIREAVLGSDHPAVASTLNAMGTVQEDVEPEQALASYARALALAERAFGPTHSRVADIYNNIGNVHNHRRDYDKARAALEHAKAIYEEVHGKDSASVAQILVNLGNTVADQGQVREAIAMYQRALEIGSKAWQPEHPNLAVIRDVLGNAYTVLGEYVTAVEHTRVALKIRTAALPADHPDIAKSHFNLASTLRVMGEYAQARAQFEASRKLYAARFGPEHPEVASVHEQLGLLHEVQEQYEPAAAQYTTALRMYEAALDPEALPLASLLRNLGDVSAARGDAEQAEPYYARALAIATHHLGANNPDLAYTLQGRGELRLQAGDPAAALPDFERALALRSAAEVDRFQLALTQFSVARALPRSQRTRARELALAARQTFAAGGDIGAPNVEEIDHWLGKHGGSAP